MTVPTKQFGFRKFPDSSTSSLAIYSEGYKRLEFGNAALSAEGAVTAAILFGRGTSTTPVNMGTTASKNMAGFWTKSAATSGDTRGLYWRHYFTGVGESGETARIYSTVNDVAASTVHGAHISLGQGSTGSVTGLGAAVRATLHINNSGSAAGTICAIMAEVTSDGATSDPAGATTLSIFRVVNSGNATGMADVDDDCVLFDFSGWTSGSGDFWYDNTSNAADDFWKIKKPDGTIAYLVSSDSTTFA